VSQPPKRARARRAKGEALTRRGEGLHVLVGVCGSSYAGITSGFVDAIKQQGLGVSIVATPAGQRYVKRRQINVFTDKDWTDRPLHIELPEISDLVVVAPITANTIGKLANGITDNLLCAAVLASRRPIVLYPAMSLTMWQAESTKRNVASLRSSGFVVSEPMPMTGLTGGPSVGFDIAAAGIEVMTLLQRTAGHRQQEGA